MIISDLNEISFFQLKENIDIKPFDCDDDDLNEFLFQSAKPYRKEMLATTFIIENKTRTLAYYSLLSDSFRVEENMFASKNQYNKFRRKMLSHPKRHLKNIPAIKIGRLAVDKTYREKGLGRIIIATIISNCIKTNDDQACRLITVDAYPKAIPFYQKLGFEYLSEIDKNEQTRLMFLDLGNFIE